MSLDELQLLLDTMRELGDASSEVLIKANNNKLVECGGTIIHRSLPGNGGREHVLVIRQ